MEGSRIARQRMTSENKIPPDPYDSDAHDEKLGTLINEYFDRCARGEKLTREQFLSEHPDVADELRDHFAGLSLIAKAGSSVTAAKLPGDETLDARGSSAEIGEKDATHLPKIDGYEIHRMIGRGGMGVVYKATQISTKRQVALKVLLEGPLASDQSRKRFEREIEVAAQLRHGNIIPIYDSGKSDGRMYYAMAFVRGMSLADHLAAKRPTLHEKLTIFMKICQAVRHAHQRGVIHRDLKPSNVLVDAENEPHILDFGLAKASTLVDMNTSVSAQIVGTPAYMSPEQAAGDPHGIDTRTDIYSLGVVLYEMIVGRMPYDTTVSIGKVLENIANAEPAAPQIVDRKISGELSAIIMKALEKPKERRYQSLDVLHSDVEKYMKGEPISVRPPSTIYFIKKAIWRNRLSLGSAAALILLAVGVGVVFKYYSRGLLDQNKALEKQKQEIAQQREQLEQEKHEAVRQRELAERERVLAEQDRDRNAQKFEQTMALLENVDHGFAAGVRSIVTGMANPTQIPEILAQGARSLAPDESKPMSKLDMLSDPRFRPVEIPAVSGKPQEEGFLSRIGKTAEELARELPYVLNAPTTRPATTSQPAAGPASQPVSSNPQVTEAGTSTKEKEVMDENSSGIGS